jgi:hypothetical protein
MEVADTRPFASGIEFFTSGALGDCSILIPQARSLNRRLAAMETLGDAIRAPSTSAFAVLFTQDWLAIG